MTKKNQNFDMYAGDTKDIVITMADGSELGGSTIRWGLKKSVMGPILTLKTVGAGISIGPTFFAVRLDSSDTIGLSSGRYYHEAEVTDSFGRVSTVTTGRVTIESSGV